MGYYATMMGTGHKPAVALDPSDIVDVLTIDGIDVSRYQGTIDWQQVVGRKTEQGQQIRFAYIKATDGDDLVDSHFFANWRDSRGLLPRGAYHFFYVTSEPEGARLQAEHFIRTVRSGLAATGEEVLELPPVIDVEWQSILGNAPADEAIDAVRTFLNLVGEAFGLRPMIYTSTTFWQARMNDTPAFAQDYPLWIAVYGAKHPDDDGCDPPAQAPRLPGDWRSFSIWQNAVQKGVPGIQGLVDRNQIALPANTTVIDFLNRLRLTEDDLKMAVLAAAALEECLALAHDSPLFQRIVDDSWAPNSPEFSVEYRGDTYRAQRAERLDRAGVRVYYVPAGEREPVHYVVRTGSPWGSEDRITSLRQALLAAAEAGLVLPFNPDAGLQRRICADHYLPISPEFLLQFRGANYLAQCAEDPDTGQVRVYYAHEPDWDSVEFFERA